MTRRLLVALLSTIFVPVKAFAYFKRPEPLLKHSDYLVLFKKGKPTNAWELK